MKWSILVGAILLTLVSASTAAPGGYGNDETPNYGNAGEGGAPVEAGALDGKAGLQEGVQAEKDAAEELRARNDITDASRSQQALKKRISNSLKQIDRIDQAGNDDAYIPWAMGFVQNAASMTAGQRMFGFGDDKKGERKPGSGY